MKNKRLISKNIVWILLLCFNGAFAQFLRQKDLYTVYINYPDYTVKVSVSNSPKRIKTKESLTYYWYSSNKIIQTKGDYEGKIVQGTYTSFYLSNDLKEKGNFEKGLKDGKWITWYENGKINEIVNWKKGQRSGEYRKLNEDESLRMISYYKNDKLNGKQISYRDGKEDAIKIFRRGEEIIQKQKDSKHKNKKFKERIAPLFKNRKKHNPTDSTKTPVPAEIENKNLPPKEIKEKSKEKEQKSIRTFKRKQKKTTPDSGVLMPATDSNAKPSGSAQEATK